MFQRFGVAHQPAIALVTPDGEVQMILGAADEEFLDDILADAVA